MPYKAVFILEMLPIYKFWKICNRYSRESTYSPVKNKNVLHFIKISVSKFSVTNYSYVIPTTFFRRILNYSLHLTGLPNLFLKLLTILLNQDVISSHLTKLNLMHGAARPLARRRFASGERWEQAFGKQGPHGTLVGFVRSRKII